MAAEQVTSTTVGSAEDAELVRRFCAGDQQALAEIYDRYASRVYTMCAHMLADRSAAEDVCGDVFLVAVERLGQLRDPSRLKPWLFAIARRQVYLKTRRESRSVLVEEVSEMSDSEALRTADSSSTMVEASAEQAELAQLIAQAAAGLESSDRLVLELVLQGIDGADLASTLGVSANNAHQASHRMKERVGQSLGALLIASRGQADCPELAAVLASWDGEFSVLWRKRVNRHVDSCEVCERSRKKVPAFVLSGVAGASPLLGVPISVRKRVLASAGVGATASAGNTVGGRPWRGDGFPPADGAARRRALVVGLAVLVVLLLVLGGSVLLDSGDTAVRSEGASSELRDPDADESGFVLFWPRVDTSLGSVQTTTSMLDAGGVSIPESTTSTVASAVTAPPITAPPATAPPATAVPPTAVPPTAAPTTAPPALPPQVSLSGFTSGCDTPYTATVSSAVGVASVSLNWTSDVATSGSVPMSGAGSTWVASFNPSTQPTATSFGFVAVATDLAGNTGSSAVLNCTR
ncbi:RNA polymerase sigma factor, sigma-70 family [Actinobacteria bacterium IMCC26207]|nr:RNA polymerase sigma factor, sigma-70 family [Actinobacteria bacterium IMCC26207]